VLAKLNWNNALARSLRFDTAPRNDTPKLKPTGRLCTAMRQGKDMLSLPLQSLTWMANVRQNATRQIFYHVHDLECKLSRVVIKTSHGVNGTQLISSLYSIITRRTISSFRAVVPRFQNGSGEKTIHEIYLSVILNSKTNNDLKLIYWIVSRLFQQGKHAVLLKKKRNFVTVERICLRCTWNCCITPTKCLDDVFYFCLTIPMTELI